MSDEPSAAQSPGRPTMEQVLGTYAAMRVDMVAELAKALGPRDWRESPSSPGPVRSGVVGAPPGVERVALATWSLAGTYPREAWHGAARLVAEVGVRHGFEWGGVTVDSADDLEIHGEDAHGARYTFGMAAHTVLTLRTGPHAWADPPGDGAFPEALRDPPPPGGATPPS